MKRIIVTGGAGYIGSHTAVKLYQAGFEPIIIDNLSNSSKKNIEGINKIIGNKLKFYNADCTKINEISNILNIEKNIVGIIHFAAFKSVEESVFDPKKYYDNNIGSLEVIIRCMKKNKIPNIIFSSSCTVYGTPDYLPINEKSIFNTPNSPYAETKQICEKIINNNSFNSISLRYFNPIGCHESYLIGDCSKDKPTSLVPIINEVAIGKRKEVIIFGNDYETIDGTCVRDYINVNDLADSHVKALNFLIKNQGKHSFNIGTGKGTSVLELIRCFEEINNIKINITIGPRRKGDIGKIWADCSKSQKKLSWIHTKKIEQSLKSAWIWEKMKNI